jgi:hypothetical protein
LALVYAFSIEVPYRWRFLLRFWFPAPLGTLSLQEFDAAQTNPPNLEHSEPGKARLM